MNAKAVLIVLCGAAAAHAHAGTLVCGGTVDMVSYEASNTSGLFMIKLSSMNTPVHFCDPETSWSAPSSGYSVSPGACKALYATFLSARLSGVPISNVYFDGNVPATCDGWTAWSSANIRHYVF